MLLTANEARAPTPCEARAPQPNAATALVGPTVVSSESLQFTSGRRLPCRKHTCRDRATAGLFTPTQVGGNLNRRICCCSAQTESLCQHAQCVRYDLPWVLPKLPVEAWIVVSSNAALEGFGLLRTIKEAGRDPQRANPVTGSPCSSDLVGLAIQCQQLRTRTASRSSRAY